MQLHAAIMIIVFVMVQYDNLSGRIVERERQRESSVMEQSGDEPLQRKSYHQQQQQRCGGAVVLWCGGAVAAVTYYACCWWGWCRH